MKSLVSTCSQLLPTRRPDSLDNHPSQPSQPSQFLVRTIQAEKHNSQLLMMKSLLSSCSQLLPTRRPDSSNDHPSQPSRPSQSLRNIPTIQGLLEAGVKICKGKGRSFLDIKFRKGVMEIPYVLIQDSTNILLRNMIAYEQIHCPERFCFTVYAVLMDYLIHTTKDVEELTYKGIIDNSLGSHEDVALLFNRIGKGIILSGDHDILNLIAEVNRYCSSKQHKWRAKLVHDYFSNPWAIFSLIGALVLLLLTCEQLYTFAGNVTSRHTRSTNTSVRPTKATQVRERSFLQHESRRRARQKLKLQRIHTEIESEEA
ncbi:hypothetical protein H6P81_017201 [Aristolochia fimbriata]|uniref:Uncharacterized protein n=1 Tax=Aristolochia fimbriata TaxID=158543 RepID=A0AAV7E0I0_ARIFI|nr:hypothetical protein H6P81_017201 [Aristolochia fimbriata]